VAQDSKQAVYWIRKAAEQGHEKAKNALKQFENK
jgi:TPR repeat protein